MLGALTLRGEGPGLPDRARVALLTRLADDLAFGIGALRARAERDRAHLLAEQRADKLRALAVEAGHAEGRERRRLALVIHDHLEQLLVGARYSLEALRSKAKARPLAQLARPITGTLDEAIEVARALAVELGPPDLQGQGLAAGLQWLGRHLGQKLGLQVEVRIDGDAEPEEAVRLTVFEAVREMLSNVAQHSGAHRAQVQLRRAGEEIEVVVSDRGRGFAEGRPTSRPALGLFGIRERLRHLGGRLEIDTAPGEGCRLTLIAPLRSRAEPPPRAGAPTS